MKPIADEIVFGSNKINYKGMQYGVVDLVPHFVETDSSKTKATKEDVDNCETKFYSNYFPKRSSISLKIIFSIYKQIKDSL